MKNLQHSAFKDIGEMSQEGRRLFLWALIGANRTGKTSTETQMIKDWRIGNPRKRVIAHDPHGFLRKAKLVDVNIPTHFKGWAKKICEKTGKEFEGMGGSKEFTFGDCLLVLDDFRTLHPWHQMQQDVIELLGQRTKMNLDIIYSVWNPINLLDQMAGFTNRYSIFYTMSQQGGFSDKIPNYIPCQKSSRLINKYVTHYGLLDKGKELYPDKFPYFLVRDDYETKATAVNVNEDMFFKIPGIDKL